MFSHFITDTENIPRVQQSLTGTNCGVELKHLFVVRHGAIVLAVSEVHSLTCMYTQQELGIK